MMRWSMWPWSRARERHEHLQRVLDRDETVNRIYREAKRQKEENHVGELLTTLFTSHPPKESRRS